VEVQVYQRAYRHHPRRIEYLLGSYQDRWSAAKLETGELIWNFSTATSNPGCDPIKSLVTDGSYVYITGLGGHIYCLDGLCTKSRCQRQRRGI
jgi:outer membrane protein assembly factor BamB